MKYQVLFSSKDLSKPKQNSRLLQFCLALLGLSKHLVSVLQLFCVKVPSGLEQSMRFFSDSETSFPVLLKCWPSREPVVEKAQQEPHCFWK